MDSLSGADDIFGKAWHRQLDQLLNTIRFVAGGPMIFAVPHRIDPELLRKMLAAVLAHHGGYSSIDYVLNRYAKQWDVEPDSGDDHVAVSRMLAAVLHEVHSLITAWRCLGPCRRWRSVDALRNKFQVCCTAYPRGARLRNIRHCPHDLGANGVGFFGS
jgi:hypothetical protein